MIEILSPTELTRAKDTGALVADILHTLKGRSTVGTNLLDIDRWAKAMIVEAGALSCYVDYEPSFGRGPFGHYICTAVNDAVLHGRPYDYTLADGDLLTLDLAVSKAGVAADAAISFIVGDAKPPESIAMIDTTERALAAGIAAAGPGARIGDISHAIGTVLSEARGDPTSEFTGGCMGFPDGNRHTAQTGGERQPESTSPLNLKRLGFQREGCSTAFRFINGEWSDHERWAITAEMAQAEAPWPEI
ncbi:Methionine aminopeptidase 1, mitochondrial [Streptomyces antimycoticus]